MRRTRQVRKNYVESSSSEEDVPKKKLSLNISDNEETKKEESIEGVPKNNLSASKFDSSEEDIPNNKSSINTFDNSEENKPNKPSISKFDDSSDENVPNKKHLQSKKRISKNNLLSTKSDSSDDDVLENKPSTSKFSDRPENEPATSKFDDSSNEDMPHKKQSTSKSDDSSSESDIDNYLTHPDKLNLKSNFFKSPQAMEFSQIEQNIFTGVNRLSDSSDSDDEPLAKLNKTDKLVTTNEPVSCMNFQQLNEYTKKIEEAKKYVEMYQAKKAKEEKKDDISSLLTLGEKNISDIDINEALANGTLHSSDFESCSEKEDWEEVEQPAKPTQAPKEGVEITLQLPTMMMMKKKKGIDLVAVMKRRLNRIKKQNQVYIHKVHLLCWIAHGNSVNSVLNQEALLAMALSLLPSQQSYPTSRPDLKYLEQIVNWYRKTVVNVEKVTRKDIPLEESLMNQISKKQADNKKMLVYIFICILRSLGMQCRLVISLQVEPLRPPASELHSLSTKENDESKPSSNEALEKTKISSSKLNCSKIKDTSKRKPAKKSTQKKSDTKSMYFEKDDATGIKEEKPPTIKNVKSASNRNLKRTPNKLEIEKPEDISKYMNKEENLKSVKVASLKNLRKIPNKLQIDKSEDMNKEEKVKTEKVASLTSLRKIPYKLKIDQSEDTSKEEKVTSVRAANQRNLRKEPNKPQIDQSEKSQDTKKVVTKSNTSLKNKDGPKIITQPEDITKSEEVVKIQESHNAKSDTKINYSKLKPGSHENTKMAVKRGKASPNTKDSAKSKISGNVKDDSKINFSKIKPNSKDNTDGNDESVESVKGANGKDESTNTTNLLQEIEVDKKETTATRKRGRPKKTVAKVEKDIDDIVASLEHLESGETSKPVKKEVNKNTVQTLTVDGVVSDNELNMTLTDRDTWRRSKSLSPCVAKANEIKTSEENADVAANPKPQRVRNMKPKLNKIKIPSTKKIDSSNAGVPQIDGVNSETDSSDSDCNGDYSYIMQVDGPIDDEPSTSNKPNLKNLKETGSPNKKHPRALKIDPRMKNVDSEDEFRPRSPFTSKNFNFPTKTPNLQKLADKKPVRTSPNEKSLDVKNDIVKLIKGSMNEHKRATRAKLTKYNEDSDSDFAHEPEKKAKKESSMVKKVKVKRRVLPRSQIDLKVFSSDDEKKKSKTKATLANKGCDIWVEVFLEAEEKWICADVVKGQVHCVKEVYSRATHPVSYILAWENNNKIKDISKRYCPNWNTVTRKLRIESKWWEQSLRPYIGTKTARDREEDEDLARQQLDQPLPKTIGEYKDHPLYVLKRHLLKFQAIYPREAITLGFVRNEAVYPRECVYTLHSREIWVKHAKVVKPGEEPYKIVKARPKYDKLSNTCITDQPLEIFGEWQVDDYVPPTAENGVVPRNAYGNVELFKPCMLPKKTVHLQLPGLNKVARKMNIDCAPAVVGFDFHSGGSHPTFDGFVVCEERQDELIAAWYIEQEEAEKREQEKYEKRVYGNWRRLTKALLIRERLKARYDFGPTSSTAVVGTEKKKPKGPRFITKKR